MASKDLVSVDDPIIEVENTSVTFEMDRGTSRVLDDVSLTIERGEVLGIVGESGSGKSMFASALLDAVVEPGKLDGSVVYYPEDGEPTDVLALSQEELRRFRWEEVAMVFQGAMASFNPTITIGKHFRETVKAHARDTDECMDRARELISDLFLEPENVLNSYPHELSGGMKQRTLIALSMILEPEVIVMDEPTAALDLLMQRSILDLVQQVKESFDVTIIFITHDLPLVSKLADRLAVLYAFQFVEIGPTEEIIKDSAHPYTRALLKAIPNLDAPLSTMQPIEGQSPDPVNVPEGCSYHPRCPLGDETCQLEEPDLIEVAQGRRSACFYWEDVSEEIPFNPSRNQEVSR